MEHQTVQDNNWLEGRILKTLQLSPSLLLEKDIQAAAQAGRT